MYEFYPNGYITEFSLGYFQPGYYTIWYYADTIGEHVTQFVLDGSFSNAVIIKVDNSMPQPQPVSPTEKELCEENPTCDWVNGQCLCKGYNPNIGTNQDAVGSQSLTGSMNSVSTQVSSS
jgi:hypothetical protein